MLNFLKNRQGKVLNLFIENSDKEYYLREVAKILKESSSHVQHALNVLTKQNILIDTRKGNLRFFKLNKSHPLLNEVKGIISKTIGVEKYLKELVMKNNEIICSFIFGSYASGNNIANSDIDLFVIGDGIDPDLFVKQIYDIQNKISREINYHINTSKELKERIAKKNNFILNILSNPITLLKGDIKQYKNQIR